ncbi:MAG: pilus assembly protein CpaE [Sporichthyaceae bacterium]
MISVTLARSLRDAGLRWEPAHGDRFVVPDRGMDDQVFVLSDMTVELHHYPGGPVIGFNGTTEWALDSVDQDDALWLPAEHQLRDLLGDGFRSLERDGAGWAAVVDGPAGPSSTTGDTPAEAYGLAVLAALLRADVPVD